MHSDKCTAGDFILNRKVRLGIILRNNFQFNFFPTLMTVFEKSLMAVFKKFSTINRPDEVPIYM